MREEKKRGLRYVTQSIIMMALMTVSPECAVQIEVSSRTATHAIGAGCKHSANAFENYQSGSLSNIGTSGCYKVRF